jgi:hypothetical protein
MNKIEIKQTTRGNPPEPAMSRPGVRLQEKSQTRFMGIVMTGMIVEGSLGSNLFGWRLPVDFDYAAKLAERISRGENGGLREQLLDRCIPYFLGVRSRFGFGRIPYQAAC